MKQIELLQKYHDEGNKVQISHGRIQVIDQEGYLVKQSLKEERQLINEILFLFREDHRLYKCHWEYKNNNVKSGSKGFELSLGVNLTFENYKQNRIITAFYNLKNDQEEARKKQAQSIRVIDEDELTNTLDNLVQQKMVNDAQTIGEKPSTKGWKCPKRGSLTKLLHYVYGDAGVKFEPSKWKDVMPQVSKLLYVFYIGDEELIACPDADKSPNIWRLYGRWKYNPPLLQMSHKDIANALQNVSSEDTRIKPKLITESTQSLPSECIDKSTGEILSQHQYVNGRDAEPTMDFSDIPF